MSQTAWEKRVLARAAAGPLEEQLRRQRNAIVLGFLMGGAVLGVAAWEFVGNLESHADALRTYFAVRDL